MSVTRLEQTVASVGTYPPTRCGVGTFTSNLAAAICAPGTGWHSSIIRVIGETEVTAHGGEAVRWTRGDRSSLSLAAAEANENDVVIVHHEYGIYAGRDGEEILDLVAKITAPVVTVLHTVLAEPTAHQREVLEALIAKSAYVVTTSAGARVLERVHGISENVMAIPHGAVANFEGDVDRGLPYPLILTWGLLGPGKGIEHGIEALAELGERDPAPHYLIMGATHPDVVARQGEAYRISLAALAVELGVSSRVHFDDTYHDWASVRRVTRTADVVLIAYDARDQISSGVLVEALTAGKIVIASAFPQAVELLDAGAGIIVEHDNTEEITAGLARALYDPLGAMAMAEAARAVGETLTWERVGTQWRSLLDEITGA